MINEQLLEKFAELEHEQWIKWSKDVASKEELSKTRLARWKKFWVPYSQLDETTKEYDRKWARKVLEILAPFLESSPQTREIQKLLEERPKEDLARGGTLRTIDWFEVFEPKLEALLADHVSQRKLGKLIEELQKERDNALEWVEETFGYGEDEESLAQAVCNAIQVFMNRIVLERLEKLLAKKGSE